MKHIWMNISYNGINFSGMASQLERRTIQGEIERTLSELTNEDIKIESSGRTDSGVHALNQFIMIKIEKDFKIPINTMVEIFNQKYEDVQIKKYWEEKDLNKHPRFSVKEKIYEYLINNNKIKDPIKNNGIYNYSKKLDINIMKDISKMFIGKKDFSSFTGGTEYKTYIREVREININKDSNNIISIEVKGPGFMRYMVRNIVGALIECGNGKQTVNDIEELFNNPKRGKFHYKAPAMGLYLKNVIY